MVVKRETEKTKATRAASPANARPTTARLAKPKVKKTPAQLERDRKSLAGEREKKRFEGAKAAAMELEATNNSRLVIFASKNGWYKLGGRSALIYHYRIAKRVGRTSRLLPDTDFFSKFREGVVSIRQVEQLEEKLKELKIYRNSRLTQAPDLYVFELGYKLDDDAIRRMYNDERDRRQKVNQMVLPNVIMPDMHMEMWEILKTGYSGYRKMPVVDREVLGRKIIEAMEGMLEEYYLVANGYVKQDMALRKILLAEERLKIYMKMVMELDLWQVEKAQRVVESLVKIERLARQALKK